MPPTRPHATKTIVTGAILAASLVVAVPASAQTYDPSYPVCLMVPQGYANYYYECMYSTMPQCQMSASGRGASCIMNPYYARFHQQGPRKKRVYRY